MSSASPTRRRQWGGLLSILLVLSGSPTQAVPTRPEVLPLPEPRLEEAEVGLRARLGEARSAIDALLARESAPADELAQAFGELGRLYLACGLNVAAAAALHNAVVLEPRSFRWAYYLGALHHRERRLVEGESALRHALEIRPTDRPALLRLGDVLLLGGRPGEARELFERALELATDPSHRAFAHYGLGKVAAAAEDWRSAAGHLEAAREAFPGASAVDRLLGLAYRELGDRERAREVLGAGGSTPLAFSDPLMESLAGIDTGAYLWPALLARQRGDLDLAAGLYRKAVDAAPAVASYRRSLSNILALRGELDAALAELEKAVELEPGHAGARLQLGELLARHKGVDARSLGHLEKAVELAPDHAAARLALARALARAQRHEEALPHYDAAVARDPRDPRSRLLRSRSLARTGRDAAAVEDLEVVLSLEPENRRAVLDLATVLSRLGQNRRALELFTAALELDLGEADRALALFSSAALRQGFGEDADAIALYRHTLELAPNMKDAHFNLATALVKTGRKPDAVEHFRRAAELAPDDVVARTAWVRLLLEAADYAGARAALEAGISTGDAEADPRLLLTLAQLLATSPDPAQRDVERAVTLATEVLRREPTLQHAATLARVLVEARRLDEAVALQRQVVADAEKLGLEPARIEQLNKVLRYYESLLGAPRAGGGSG